MKDFEDDNEAWTFLKSRGFIENHFVIKIPKNIVLSEDEIAAIQYLSMYWDWAWEQYEKF